MSAAVRLDPATTPARPLEDEDEVRFPSREADRLRWAAIFEDSLARRPVVPRKWADD